MAHSDFCVTRRQTWFLPRSHSLYSGKQLQSTKQCCCCSHCKAFAPRLLLWWLCQATHTLHCPSARKGLLKVSSGRLRSPRDLEWLRSVLSANVSSSCCYFHWNSKPLLAWNSMDCSQRTSPTDWGSNGSENPVHLPLTPWCGGFSKYSQKTLCLRTNGIEMDRLAGDHIWIPNRRTGRKSSLDWVLQQWLLCRDTITNFCKWPACVQEGVKSANHVCHHRMGTTGQLRESNRQWSLLIYESSHVLIYGASPHPFQKRLISKMMKL